MGFVATFRAHDLMKLGVKELIELCIYCWGHPLLYTFSGSVAVWMLLSGNLQQMAQATERRRTSTLTIIKKKWQTKQQSRLSSI